MLPEFNRNGDLPEGIHRASLREALERFGADNAKRRSLSQRLSRIYKLALETGQLAQFIIFGSFITNKPYPNDVDVFLLMENDFDLDGLRSEDQIFFNHLDAQAYFGASVFWVKRRSALGGEKSFIEFWQIKRDGGRRGLVEIISED